MVISFYFQFDRFMTRHPHPSLSSTYTSLSKKIEDNIEWMSTNQAPISTWLQSINGFYTTQQGAAPTTLIETLSETQEAFQINVV